MSDAPPGWEPKKPPPSGDHEKPPKRKRYWWRFTLAAAIIVAVSAAATATSILVYLDSIAHALSHNNVLSNRLHKYLSNVEAGAPENILILGSDKRANIPEAHGRSDTTILLRLDPDKNTIAVMSIPRDLLVEIPGVGTEKFNAAYAYGGPKLTLQVVKELTGLKINHVVNVDFLGFVQAVDAIGCVYTDVDRRYYHSNVGVAPGSEEEYSEINIQPGYQKLCGKKALEYVRYRHTDSDIVRAARQQDFISSARAQVSIQDLVFDQSNLIDIFTEYTTSDISDKETMLEVLKLFIASRNASIEEVHFPGEFVGANVAATPEAIHEAVQMFLGSEPSTGPRGTLEGSETEEKQAPAKKKNAKAGKSPQVKKKAKPHIEAKPPGSDGLVPAVEAGEAEGKTVRRRVGGGFPVYYPTRLPSGAYFAETNLEEHVIDPRVYHIRDTDEEIHPAYRMVGIWELGDGPHYFGIQGIHGWEDPPILDDPSVTETIHHREYEIFTDSGRIKLIAWRRGENVYWVSNDLLETLSNDQMIGIATSARVLLPKAPPRKRQAASGG